MFECAQEKTASTAWDPSRAARPGSEQTARHNTGQCGQSTIPRMETTRFQKLSHSHVSEPQTEALRVWKIRLMLSKEKLLLPA